MKTENMTISNLTGAYTTMVHINIQMIDHPEWTLHDLKKFLHELHDEICEKSDTAIAEMLKD